MKVQRYKPFSLLLKDIRLENHLRKNYIENKALCNIKVDIILPTYNRSEVLGNAIDSVLNQLHQNWRLFVCDDGSSDHSSDKFIQDGYSKDSRITYLKLNHEGVSSARNAGLRYAQNNYVCFLDSDNTWSPEYLSLMLSFMNLFELDSAYCAARLIGDLGERWLGDYFSWHACAEQNYIDINCFMMKMPQRKLFFDETLQRLVDWDYILEATKKARISYLPIPLVDYCNKKSISRITTTVYQNTELAETIKFIQAKHCCTSEEDKNVDARLENSFR